MGPFWLLSPPIFHSRAPISCRSPPSSPAAPLSHQPSTISASHRCLSDLDGTHSRGPHILSFSSLLSHTSFSPSSPRHRRLPDLDGTHFQAPHLLLFSSLLSRTTSSALAFHHLRFPSSPPRSEQNPFSSPPSPIVLPPLPHQPFTVSASLSSPPRFGQNPFLSPPSPVFSSLLLAPPLPHQPSTIFASRRHLLDLDGTHSRAPHLLPFSSLLSCTSLSPSSLAVVDAVGTEDWEQEISTEPIALLSSLLSRTILSRFPLAVVDAVGMGDREREQEISTEPIAPVLLLPLVHQPFTILALPSWMPLGQGSGAKDQDGGKESMVAGESQGGVRLPESEPESELGVGKRGTRT